MQPFRSKQNNLITSIYNDFNFESKEILEIRRGSGNQRRKFDLKLRERERE